MLQLVLRNKEIYMIFLARRVFPLLTVPPQPNYSRLYYQKLYGMIDLLRLIRYGQFIPCLLL